MQNKLNIDWAAIDRLLSDPREDFVSLAKVAGLDPMIDFIGADLRNVDFGDCDLAGYDFTLADLAGADLTKARIEGAVFDNARGLDTTAFPKPEH